MAPPLHVSCPLLVLLLPGALPQAGPSDSGPRAPLQHTGWLREVRQEISGSEYSWSPATDGAYSAPNRSQGLRSRIGAQGIEVFPRETPAGGGAAPWKLRLETVGFGYEGDERPIGGGWLAPDRNRLERRSAPLSEWYVNDERGIEQGWTIPAPPPGRTGRPLRIELASEGLRARASGDGRSAVFVDEHGGLRLRYHGLRSWDATGRELDASLSTVPGGLAIELLDRGALYPVTVDPVLSGPAWTAEGDQSFAAFGYSVSGAGDVNGDGFDDVIVGAPAFDNGESDEGRAFLYLGSPSGPSLAPDWTAECDQADAQFGISVSGAGDVDGDGFDDVVVGANQFDGGQTNEGRAFLYLGSASGPSLAPDWTAESDQTSASFGRVSAGGDVNGDGFDDVIVGAHLFDNGQTNEGRAFLYLGSASGPSLAPDWTAESDQEGALLGLGVSGAGDLNGDGYDDVIVGARHFDDGESNEGRAFLYLGSASGPSLVPDWTAESDQAMAQFGRSVSGAGDVNGDGFDDVIVGARLFDNGETQEGRAFLYLGSASGPSLAPDWTAESDQASAEFGWSVSGAGDVNGDGFDDVVVGARRFDGGQPGEGRAFLYLGSASGVSVAPDWTAESDQAGTVFGESVSGAGDVNGDGFDDVVVGASAFNNGEFAEGRAFLYVGQGPIGTTYCNPGDGSGNNTATLSASGCSLAGPVTLDLANGPPNQFCYLLIGDGNAVVQQPPGAEGDLCVTGGSCLGRYAKDTGSIDSAGTFSTDVSDSSSGGPNFGIPVCGGNIQSGETWYFQYWHRQAMGQPSTFSEAIEVTFE